MEIKNIIEMFTDAANDLGATAQWYADNHESHLSEQCRYCQRTVLDVIDIVNAECKTPDDVDELLEEMRSDDRDTYKFLQSEHFDRLADLSMLSYVQLVQLSDLIERNK